MILSLFIFQVLSGPYIAETLIQKDIEKTAFEGNVLDFVWREWF